MRYKTLITMLIVSNLILSALTITLAKYNYNLQIRNERQYNMIEELKKG